MSAVRVSGALMPLTHADLASADWAQLQALLDILGAQGYSGMDPLRYAYLQALLRRGAGQPDKVKALLAARAVPVLLAYWRACCGTPTEVPATQAQTYTQVPAQCSALRALTQQLAQGADALKAEPVEPSFEDRLAQQERRILQALEPAAAGAEASIARQAGQGAELQATRHLRAAWLKRHFDKRVTQVIKEGPEAPGPLNPNMLVIRSLDRMRALSPDYLYRYLAYLDTLLWLEAAGGASETAGAAKPATGRAKPRSGPRK